MDEQAIVELFCATVNKIKRTGFTQDMVDKDWHLGGDFGIESVEMLEIWLELEKKLRIKILDENKRDIYTLRDVMDVLEAHQLAKMMG